MSTVIGLWLIYEQSNTTAPCNCGIATWQNAANWRMYIGRRYMAIVPSCNRQMYKDTDVWSFHSSAVDCWRKWQHDLHKVEIV